MTDTPPRDYHALQEAITERRADLSKRLRQIAAFALDHPTEMALETIAVIARRAEVQPSALIRFAKAFGYSGFSDMQRTFQAHVAERSASYKERVRTALTSESSAGPGGIVSLLRAYCATNIVSLEHLRDSPPTAQLKQARRMLKKAQHVYVIAQRRSLPVAAYLVYALNHGDCRAHLLDGVGGLLMEEAGTMREQDLLIAVSFRPYSPETIDVVAHARGQGIPIIGITDNNLSPIAESATVCLAAQDAEVHTFRSLTAAMCIAQTLATSMAFEGKDGANRAASLVR